jgi:hypothetical protein
MKYLTLSVLFATLIAFVPTRAWAEDDEEQEPSDSEEAKPDEANPDEAKPDEAKPEGPVADPAVLLKDLTAANANKDSTAIGLLLDKIIQYAKTAKDEKFTDPLGKELVTSYKVADGNWGTMRKILDAMGELRSKKAESMLKKVAFQKKVKDEQQEELQINAIAAIGAYASSKQIDPLIDLSKSQNTKIAVAAYAAFKSYGVAKGKDRKKVAEELMKRLESENPYTTSSSGNNPGEDAIKRWGEVQKPIVTSLQAVCHEATINDLDNWREWWKENKKSKKAWADKKAA